MRRRQVGTSGLQVSRIGLGTMTWGDDTDLEAATDQLVTFVDAGGSLVETCDAYADGAAQEILGEVMTDSVPREDVVISARGGLPGGASGDLGARGALLDALDASLRRLRVDHVDLWQLPGWDAAVPLEETLSAVQVAVMSGKARYAGLVGPSGWQLATVVEKARTTSGVAVPVAAQVEYSLLTRGVEVELVPAAEHHGLGLVAWAPLGRGVLTGKYVEGTPADSRAASAVLAPYVEARRNERSARIVQSVLTAADGLGTSPLAVALAWVRDRPGVASAVVGARDGAQLAASLATEKVELPAEIRAALDDVSIPI
ncbi:MAG: aldo/keto reductase [Pseudonocardia sp.]|uniref:aldo/keto reductase n=1 Tax=unclassified Pseudonocardia TaxID=2619320 RepID=UPI00086939CC|nr:MULTISPECIES: aldo/keto reductase [unclassified Pseudonocardia]MBN9108390.1 aldo/keto reductase [Pseudonocardia sp.]ODV08762.1 MAG: aldo/keto reductase [Pseudonocardia sp. SCN 73-27]